MDKQALEERSPSSILSDEEDEVAPSVPLPPEQQAPTPCKTPHESNPRKKRRLTHIPDLSHLPANLLYHRSYMHRSVITDISITSTTIICASDDGRLTFWHRNTTTTAQPDTSVSPDSSLNSPLTFIKGFQAHKGPVSALHVTKRQDAIVTTSSSDRSLKVFTISTVDLAQFTTLPFEPSRSLTSISSPDRIIVPFQHEAYLLILSLNDVSLPGVIIPTRHQGPISLISVNPLFNSFVLCTSSSSALDYACIPPHNPYTVNEENSDDEGDKTEHQKATRENKLETSNGIYLFKEEQQLDYNISGLKFQSRLRTDLLSLARAKTSATCIATSPTGTQFVVAANDHRIRVFNFLTGRVCKVYDEGRATVESPTLQLPAQELARRRARDEEYRCDEDSIRTANVVWDESGTCIIYATMLGIKVIHLASNRVVRALGAREAGVRFVCVALALGAMNTDDPHDMTSHQASNSINNSSGVTSSKSSQGNVNDKRSPLLVASAFNSERIYLFSSGGPSVTEGSRDVYNERPMVRRRLKGDTNGPTKKSRLDSCEPTAEHNPTPQRLTLHTSVGDILIGLLPEKASKAVENFVTHGRNGYFNGISFHRVIKNFMIQTGDPDGDGTGGESIWGASFEDEIDEELSHEVGTVSMANSGPNTNGSQFFIVCGKATHLDGKHTIFGKVSKGIGVVRQIEAVKTDKRDKPIIPVTIESVSVHEEN